MIKDNTSRWEGNPGSNLHENKADRDTETMHRETETFKDAALLPLNMEEVARQRT